jgi:hypothetical protein
MKSWAKIAALTAMGMAIAGCGSFFGLRKNSGYSPEYCYDCHYQPRWTKAYDDCSYYIFQAEEARYKYRPRSNDRAAFSYKIYDIKTVRERQKADYEYRQELKKSDK